MSDMPDTYVFHQLHGVSLRFDGAEILHATVTSKRPENHEEMKVLLRALLDSHDAPVVEDVEMDNERREP